MIIVCMLGDHTFETMFRPWPISPPASGRTTGLAADVSTSFRGLDLRKGVGLRSSHAAMRWRMKARVCHSPLAAGGGQGRIVGAPNFGREFPAHRREPLQLQLK